MKIKDHIVKQVLQKPDAMRRKEGTGNETVDYLIHE